MSFDERQQVANVARAFELLSSSETAFVDFRIYRDHWKFESLGFVRKPFEWTCWRKSN